MAVCSMPYATAIEQLLVNVPRNSCTSQPVPIEVADFKQNGNEVQPSPILGPPLAGQPILSLRKLLDHNSSFEQFRLVVTRYS